MKHSEELILPQDTHAALLHMINLTEECITAFENETNTIALSDNMQFIQKSRLKAASNTHYAQAGAEFMRRKDEFLRSRSHLLKELVELQKRLKGEVQINMSFLVPIVGKMKSN